MLLLEGLCLVDLRLEGPPRGLVVRRGRLELLQEVPLRAEARSREADRDSDGCNERTVRETKLKSIIE